jgi:nondiscriminating glutamyl-tRNA synthetase
MTPEELKLKKPGEVRTRIAPSPTGHMHIGLARTALFNYLYAKKHLGAFILRIEDTDSERSSLESEKNIIENLKWLGIDWDEGPIINNQKEELGNYGPYRQSKRQKIYAKYLRKLLDEKKAYYCFCSEEELEAQRQYQMSQGLAPKYSGKCAKLDEKTVKKYLFEKKQPVIRFKVKAEKINFNDLIRGKVEFDTGLIGDIVIAKNINYPLYNFAAVIDDFEMKISHIIRGEEHISNTPKQILIQKALSFPQPFYAHLPLILGEDRSKLSKRHGSFSVSEFKKEGYLPETLVNFVAFLGWNPGDELKKEDKSSFYRFAGAREREIYSIASLIKEFSLEKVQKSGAIFNIKKLDFLNGFYIRHRSIEKLTELCLPYLIRAKLLRQEDADMDLLKKIVLIYQERLKKISEIVELADYFFKEELDYNKRLLQWKNMTEQEIKDSLSQSEKTLSEIQAGEWNKQNLENILMPQAEKMTNRGNLLWPLRAALTGKKSSAGPFEVAEILGKEKTLKRIKQAKKLLDTRAIAKGQEEDLSSSPKN